MSSREFDGHEFDHRKPVDVEEIASQLFFVRNCNASQPLSGAEQHAYIQDRFD